MERRRRIILYGQSIILSSVGASLRRYAGLEVVPLAAPWPAAPDLAALAPDVILFDTAIEYPEAALLALAAGREVLLIGVSLASAEAVVWTGRQMSACSAQDLVDKILETEQARTL